MLNRWVLMVYALRFLAVLAIALGTIAGWGADECAQRIVIVNPWSSSRFLVRELQARGIQDIYGLLTMRVPHWATSTYRMDPQRVFDATDHSWSDTLGKMRGLNPTHMILGADSDGGFLTDFLTDGLQLDGNPTGTTARRRRKMETQQVYRDHGRPYIRSVMTTDVEEAVKLAEETGYPLYLKPNSDGGSSHNFEVHSELELRRDFPKMLGEKNASTSKDIEAVLVGEFVPGREFAIQGVVYRGRTFITSILEYDKIRIPGRGRLYRSEWIIAPESAEARQMIDFVLDGNALLELQHAAFHWEVKIDSRTGLAVPMELNARLAGSSLPEFFKDCLGYSDVDLLADIFQDPQLLSARPERYTVPSNGHGLRFVVRTPRAGLNLNRETLARVSDHPGFIRVRQLLGGYDNLPESVDLDTVPVILEYKFPTAEAREAFRQKLIALQDSGKFFQYARTANRFQKPGS